jgi:hypothetical protein
MGGGIPAVSWARVAMSIVSARQSNGVLLTVDFADQPPLTIDLERHEFSWEGMGGPIPAHVSVMRVMLLQHPTADVFVGHDLDLLLWAIGLTAFGDERAGWLAPDSRVRLVGWPNLTVLDHSAEQVRMTAALGTMFLTAEELATSVEVSTGEAQRLINALGLMDLLLSAPMAETVAPILPQAPRGLFRRLRDRLGL